MDPKRWKQIDELVDAALDLPEAERGAFIDASANGDDELRRAVTELIGAQNKTNEFLNQSAMRIVARAIAIDEPTEKLPSLINAKIATYRIERMLGAGGMGEVYLAFDEKLKRKVALKILPKEFGSNDERVRRFELEARAISSLNHPNIVTIYDVGNADGINYIATEFVEGKTLRELIAGKFKLRNVMANSIQICDALSAAHQAGVIHRDIKPENIMIRNDGYAKILDFGVAKLTEVGPETLRDLGSNTTRGMILGTPAYMSPAQVSGELLDPRTDIWSCGVVLYEFMTGKNPFKGANRAATFQAILTGEPASASSLNAAIPAEVDRILMKIMEKDPDLGYQTAADLRADLKRVKRELDTSPSGSYSGQTRQAGPKTVSTRWALAAAAVFVISTVAISGWFLAGGNANDGGSDWSAAKNIPLTDQPGTEYYPSLSPDGKSFVYAGDSNGRYDIFIQRVGSKKPTPLTVDSPADDTQPAFSPDGNRIAFRSEREPKGIYVIEQGGENPRLICNFGYHPSWSPDGREIVVSSFGRDQPTVRSTGPNFLAAVNVETGARRDISDIEASFPTWSPSGARIAYWFYTETFGKRDIATIPAGGGEPVVITKDFAVSNWNPVWSPDGKFLYFVSNKNGSLNIWRVALDESTGAVLSEPEPVGTPSKFSRHINFSLDGKRMIYVQTNNQANIQGVEFDPKTGKVLGEPKWITEGDREITRAELSPDGTRFAMRLIRRTQDDIVTVGRDGRDWRDVTNDAPFDRYVRWSPDGKLIAFNSDRNGANIWISNPDGTNMRQLTFSESKEESYGFPVWAPDGKRMVISLQGQPYILDPFKAANEQTAVFLKLPPGVETFTTWDWSPDGTMLAGVMGEGMIRSIGVYSLETGEIRKLADKVNQVPAWLPDSKSLIYGADNKAFLIDVTNAKEREILSSSNVDIRSPFVSRDGRLLYYSASTSESDIWLLDNTGNR